MVNIIIQIKLYQETAIKIFKSGNTKRVMFKSWAQLFQHCNHPFQTPFIVILFFTLSTISAGSPFLYAYVGVMTLVHSKGQTIFAKCQMCVYQTAK